MNTDRLIRGLLRLYPRAFRERYGDAMIAFHHERMREGATWPLTVIADHVTSAIAEHFRAWSSIPQDVRYAVRGLARRPLFATVVIATIALGVGANAAIYSVVRGVLLRPLAYPDADRVVSFTHTAPYWLASVPEYLDYKRDAKSFESLAAFVQGEANLANEEEPERIATASVTTSFFDVLAVSPQRGRLFAPDDDLAPGTLAVISHRLWERRFAADSSIVGKSITLGGRRRAVIGVMPPHFDYPNARTDVWVAMPRMNPDSPGDRTNHALFMVGRVRERVELSTAVAEVNAVASRMQRDFADRYDPNQPLTPDVQRVSDKLVGGTRAYLWALAGAVGFVLLIVCANVASLLLARGEGRRKEMALRTALGASRRRIATQLLTESGVLACGGGALGLALAWAGSRALIALAPASLPRVDQISIDGSVLAFTLAAALGAGLLFGFAPALYASRNTPGDILKDGARSSRGAGSHRARRAFVVAEVALAVIALTGAGMLVRSLTNLQSAELGFDERSVLTARVSPLQIAYDESRATVFYAQLLERVRAIPGVVNAGAAGWLPVVDAGGLWGLLPEGKSYSDYTQSPIAAPQQITPGYFAAMGMPIRVGRDFSEHDRAGGPFVTIVSSSMAAQLWPNADPIGKRFQVGGNQAFVSVVGVVDDIRARGFHNTSEPTMYFPYPQTRESAYTMPRAMNLVIRTQGQPLAVSQRVREIVRALDATIPVSNVRTMEMVVGTSVANRRFTTALIAAFAVLALVLAGIGIYGVVAYGVTERMFEIGVRVALGAERSAVLALIIRDGVWMAAIGVVIGFAGALAAARAIKSMLVDVPAVDVVTLAAASATLIVVALVASAIPARRALNVHPSQVLRGG
ncbi:MAG TPA: ABC transporter permease [Gemmatimonadaceae bacterium]|nr:ABC transporter permease [Gemmatimonadaceae bacterium]